MPTLTSRKSWGVLAALTLSTVTLAPHAQSASSLVFVGTYTGAASKGIYAFRFDERAGTFAPLGLAAEATSPSFLTASRDGRFVYAVNETSTFKGAQTGSVTAFRVNATAGTLTTINTVSSGGTDPCHLALDRSGKFLAVANYSDGHVAILRVNADGTLATPPLYTIGRVGGSGPNAERQAGPHAHQVVFSNDNRFLLSVDLGADQVFVSSFDATTGAANQLSNSASLAPGSGPRHLAFTPDARSMFVINELRSTITSFAWDATRGALARRATVTTLPSAFRGTSSTAEIAIHPNGRFLYGSNRGHDSIAVFAIGSDSALTLVGHTSTRGKTPRHFAIAPTGRWLIVANQDTNTLAVFGINPTTGTLSPVGPLVDVGAPVNILFAS